MQPTVCLAVVALCVYGALGAKERDMKAQIYQGAAAQDSHLRYVVNLSAGGHSCLGAIIKEDMNDKADTILTSRECLVMLDYFKKLGDNEIWVKRVKENGDVSTPEKRRVGYHTDAHQFVETCFDANGFQSSTCSHLAVLHVAAPFTEPPTEPWLGIKLGESVPLDEAVVIGGRMNTQQQNVSQQDNALSPIIPPPEVSWTVVNRVDQTTAGARLAALSTDHGWFSNTQARVRLSHYTDDTDNFWFTENVVCDYDWGAIFVTNDISDPRLVGVGTSGVCQIGNSDKFEKPSNNNHRDCVGQWMDAVTDGFIPELGCGDPKSVSIVINTVPHKPWIWASNDVSTYVPVAKCMNDVALLSVSERAELGGVTICTTLTQVQTNRNWNEVHVNFPDSYQLTTATKVKRVIGFASQPDDIVINSDNNKVQLRWQAKPDWVTGNTGDNQRRFAFEVYGLRNPNNCCAESGCESSQLMAVTTWWCPPTPLHGVQSFLVRSCDADPSTTKVVAPVTTPKSTVRFVYPDTCNLCNACYSWISLAQVSLWKCEHEGREYIRQGGNFPPTEDCYVRGVPPSVDN